VGAIRLDGRVVCLCRLGVAHGLKVDRLHELVRTHIDDGDCDLFLAGHVQKALSLDRDGRDQSPPRHDQGGQPMRQEPPHMPRHDVLRYCEIVRGR